MASGWVRTVGYPVTGDSREEPFLACWILLLLAVAIPVLPAVPVVGYLVRVLVAGARETDAPSFLADPVSLLRRGVGGTLVVVAYLVGPAIALFVTVYGATGSSAAADLNFSTGVLFYAGSTAVLCLALLGAYLCPVGLYAYGERGALRAALSPARIRPVAAHAAYFTRWVAGATLLAVVVALATASLAVARVGPVVATGVLAYGSILVASVWGRGIGLANRR